jgi:hypothetical protein
MARYTLGPVSDPATFNDADFRTELRPPYRDSNVLRTHKAGRLPIHQANKILLTTTGTPNKESIRKARPCLDQHKIYYRH